MPCFLFLFLPGCSFLCLFCTLLPFIALTSTCLQTKDTVLTLCANAFLHGTVALQALLFDPAIRSMVKKAAPKASVSYFVLETSLSMVVLDTFFSLPAARLPPLAFEAEVHYRLTPSIRSSGERPTLVLWRHAWSSMSSSPKCQVFFYLIGT